MPTTRRSAGSSGQAPAPDRTPEQAQTGSQQQADQRRPRFVPQHVARRQQAGGQAPQPGRTPPSAGQPVAPPRGSGWGAQHTPRGLGGALGSDGGPRQQPATATRARPQAAGGRAGASYTGNVIGQWSANYPNNVWFFDGNLWQWMMLDQTSESAVMLMNEVVSLARAHTLPLYYDTDDTTGMVVDVYTF